MSKVVCLFGTKGGVGITTVALNLAVSLSLEKKKVLLLGLNLEAPLDIVRMCKIKPKRAMADLITVWDKVKKDKALLETFLTSINPYLDFLSVEGAFLRIVSYRKVVEHVEKTLELFKNSDYDFVIIDGGKNLNDILIKTFDNTNLIFLVVTPDILSLYQTRWTLDTLQTLGFPSTMIKVVLNRSESEGGVSLSEIRLILPVDILSLIPSDGRTAGFALNRGVPLVLDSPKSKVCTAIKSLAKILADKEDIYISYKKLTDLRIEGSKTLKEKIDTGTSSLGLVEPLSETRLKEEDPIVNLKIKAHQCLIEEMDLKRNPLSLSSMDAEEKKLLEEKVKKLLSNILAKEAKGIISSVEVRRKLMKEIIDEALGLGPLEDLVNNTRITEIMVNNKDQIYIEKEGRIELTNKRFTSDEQIRIIIDRILAPLGRRVDESFPYVDARLPDGSRVNAIIPPLSLTGSTLTIRKFMKQSFAVKDLIGQFESLTQAMANFLRACVIGQKNIIISGGTGSGKTTLLNILSEFIPDEERIMTIEDSAELKLHHQHWIRLEARPANIEGRGEVTIGDLFRNALRMRPDRIVVGECRGREVLDMLQAMNTGHDGSMSTLHANSTKDVLIRLDSMILMSGIELPLRAIREMISSAVNLIVHTARLSDGSRKITQITEVVGMKTDIELDLKDIFAFEHQGLDEKGKCLGCFSPTGYIPTFFKSMKAKGIAISEDIFHAKS